MTPECAEAWELHLRSLDLDDEEIEDVASDAVRDAFESGWEARGIFARPAGRRPGPATRELLELFREILARPHDNVSVARMTMRAVLAEHEAAQSGMGSIVEGLGALREAGGEAWDQVADPAEYLGRKEPDGSRLPELSEAFLLAWDAGGFGCHLIAPDLRAAIAEHEVAQKGAGG